MIDIKTIKQLIKLMADNGLSELEIKDQDEQVTLKRNSGSGAAVMMPPTVSYTPAPAPAAPVAAPGAPAAAAPAAADDTAGLIKIESPMVGTFYSAATPDSEPYAKVGTSVNANSVVCIIEAMKVFNEIKAECSGKIEKVLVKNGDAVEFGQPMFLVRPE